MYCCGLSLIFVYGCELLHQLCLINVLLWVVVNICIWLWIITSTMPNKCTVVGCRSGYKKKEGRARGER